MKTILMVDDEPYWFNIYANYLQMYHLQDIGVVYATSAQEGLEKVENSSFDLILSDLQMEKVAGYRYAGEYFITKVKEKHGHIPVILLSSASNLAVIARKVQAKKYFKKTHVLEAPFLLVQSIQELLGIEFA